MSISRSEILRRKKRTEVEKLMGDHGRSCEVCGGYGRSLRGPGRSVGGPGRSVSGPGRSVGG